MKRILSALVLSTALIVPAVAQESNGTITIPITEYEKLKKATEVKKDKQYWNMTYEQILDFVGHDESKAWKLYEYWVLRQLYMNGTIGSNVNEAIKNIGVLNEIDSTKPITIVFDSPGGYVYNGLMLYNAMMSSKAPIHTVCDTITASMAAVLFAAGDHRVAKAGCHFMIHELGSSGNISGKTTDFLTFTEFAIDLENILLRILSENSGLSMSEIRTLGEYETFYDAEEIARLGFADVVDARKPRQLGDTRDIPEDLLPANRIKKNIVDKMTR